MTTTPEPTVRTTRYEVSCLPEDHIDANVFTLAVEYRGHGLWAVRRLSQCMDSDGTWDYEPSPSSREDDWLATHRFPLDQALVLAKEHAQKVTVNGWTVQEVLDEAAESAKEDTDV